MSFSSTPELRNIPQLLRGDAAATESALQPWSASQTAVHLSAIILGAGCYGAVMGWWRSETQAFFTACKLPLVVLLTTLGNALLNGMLAPLLGSRFDLRQSLRAVLMSFSIASIVLASLSPLVGFIIWNIPPARPDDSAVSAYRFMQLVHVLVISVAGIMAHVNLFPLLQKWSVNRMSALRVMLAWLAGNLFLGSQICWILRPFIGRPGEPVEFIGPVPFQGSLFETVFDALRHLLTH